jgi:hypothetical protein
MTKGGFFMLKKGRYYASVLLLCLLLVLTGCGQSGGQPKAKAYSNDGYMGITDANPNIPTNRSFHTYAVDKSLVLQALQPISGIRSSRIIFRGPNLSVHLDLDPAIDTETAMRIKQTAFEAVSEMMPRYRVKVNVGKNKLMMLG